MPTVAVDKQELFQRLGRSYTTDEFDELCFEFGIELDEDTEAEGLAPGERPELKIDIGANRYDMLCIEGIARALNIFLGRQKVPNYRSIEASHPLTIHVDPATEKVRPFVAGAVLRNISFNQHRYESFIALQDKLHSNLCRNRSLVAIGTHDLDKMKGTEIYYKAVKPRDVRFVPLNQTKEMNGEEIMEFYEKDKNLARFLHLIRDSPVYPVYYDEEMNVMSLPPIINSEKTKIDLNTKNVFIDLSGTDRTKIEIVVNQLVAMFSEYTAEPFTIEPVKIISEHNNLTRQCPNVKPRSTTAEIDYINSCLGLSLSGEELSALLAKMSLMSSPDKTNSNLLDVSIPCTRSDILHQCDIMEDAGIGYGFNNLKKTFPSDSFTIGKPFSVNRVGDIFRVEVAMAGWTEVMPLTLCSHDENFKYLRLKDEGKTAVVLANPKTTEYQVVRTSLIPGVLKTVKENLQHSLPIKVFEVGDVVFKDLSQERRARNERRFCAIYAGKTSGFEMVHGLLDRIMKMLNIPWLEGAHNTRGYWIEEDTSNPTFFPGRGAKVFFKESPESDVKVIGSLGVFHPEVLENYEIPYAASAVELMVEPFVIPEVGETKE